MSWLEHQWVVRNLIMHDILLLKLVHLSEIFNYLKIKSKKIKRLMSVPVLEGRPFFKFCLYVFRSFLQRDNDFKIYFEQLVALVWGKDLTLFVFRKVLNPIDEPGNINPVTELSQTPFISWQISCFPFVCFCCYCFILYLVALE